MKQRAIRVGLFGILMGTVASLGCVRAVSDGVAIGLTEGIGDAVASLIGDVAGSINLGGAVQ